MRTLLDAMSNLILKLLNSAGEPLETKEVEEKLEKSAGKITRIKVLYRLSNLRGEGLIKGKFAGPGKGVWIWWSHNLFKGGKK